MSKEYFVAVSGQPNCGKSTMFNALTGATARVGNYPGITVDRTEGRYCSDVFCAQLVDLPGTYSLTSYSMEEVVARDVIVDEKPDVVINMLDATSLERSLYLAVQFMEIGVPVVLGLNMMDEVRKKGIRIDSKKLSELMGVPVIECIARRGVGKDELMEAVQKVADETKGKWNPVNISYGHDLDPVIEEMTELIIENDFMTERYDPHWLAVKYLEEDEIVMKNGRDAGPLSAQLEEKVKSVSEHIQKTLNTYPEAVLADYRYGFINSILKQGVISREDNLRFDFSDKMDLVLTHKFLGPVIMLLVMYGMFYVTFNLGATPQGWVEDGFGWISDTISLLLPDGMLKSMLVSGVIDGVGAVMGFTPLILIMFAMLVFLEDLGYMARVSYMVDRVFRMFGLHGMSIMPFIMSGGLPGGCAVPGVMTCRTLRSPKERIATILTAPFMICGAKATAYLMLVGAFYPDNATSVMFFLVLISWALALCVGRILRWTALRGESTPFVMELPPYRMPTLHGVAIHTWDRVWQYIKKAGTVILAISILMWALMTFPKLPAERVEAYEAQRVQVTEQSKSWAGTATANQSRLDEALSRISYNEGEEALKKSYAGQISEAISPVTDVAGFPWQANIAFIGAFAAKEVFVSTMSTAYSLGDEDPENPTSLSEKIAADKAWTPAVIWSVFLFMMVYVPCMVTVAVIIRETNWKWGLFSVFGSLGFGYSLSVLIYQVGSFLGY
ncbi:ferrous iron transport protein B [Maridesulfovibrio hydrothermalis]|uniref:Ferrous iron transport protein B n=1 Tax=Maridesulfovibrio hydrothermalis AM13 = DSM 14728 TaxID=1121451 RepID=L0RBP6_9BACT|nr:ferrous iron transport protein B [Maridesulfovibrio hydrothermalis]CCO24184.1 Ferrous iron transport protein B [Maridesulfovibrio hydrothermalis AM13 = DSM 14728]